VTVMLDFRPEMEICPFRVCAVKNVQYRPNPYLWPNRQNSRVLREIVVGEHDGGVRLYSESGKMAISRMRNENFITGIVRTLWTWLWDGYHVPQNAFHRSFNGIL